MGTQALSRILLMLPVAVELSYSPWDTSVKKGHGFDAIAKRAGVDVAKLKKEAKAKFAPKKAKKKTPKKKSSGRRGMIKT